MDDPTGGAWGGQQCAGVLRASSDRRIVEDRPER